MKNLQCVLSSCTFIHTSSSSHGLYKLPYAYTQSSILPSTSLPFHSFVLMTASSCIHPSARPPPRTHALLQHISPTFSACVSIIPPHHPSISFFRRRFHLQLRANVLLLFTQLPDDNASLQHLHRTLPLSSDLTIRRTATTLYISRKRFQFHSPDDIPILLNHLRPILKAPPPASYRLLREIGHGASGVVHLATTTNSKSQSSSPSLYAIKTIPKHDIFFSLDRLQNLISERLALVAQNQHTSFISPFLLRLHDAFETRTNALFVTEYAPFGDLHNLVSHSNQRRLDESVARVLFVEMLLGLQHLHERGFLYRDFKLANVLINRNGHVRLADFGLAKRLNTLPVSPFHTKRQADSSSGSLTLLSSLTSSEDDEFEKDQSQDQGSRMQKPRVRLVGRTRSFVGTRRYMSPEHLTSGRASRGYGAASDVWALGVSLYVMLTGRYPFGQTVSSGNSVALFMAIKSDELVFPKHVSPSARRLVTAMLRRDCAERADLQEIKEMEWLADVDWQAVLNDGIADSPVHCVLQAVRNVPNVDHAHLKGSLVHRFVEESGWRKSSKRDEGILGFDFLSA